MKILVTGGAGFIGSNLVQSLLLKGLQVVVIDDLSSGYQSNLSDISKDIFMYEDKIESFSFEKLQNIDAVVHLAAQASVPVSINKFEMSSTSNMLGTIRVIDYCRLNNVPLIYASSSAIYGNLALGDDSKEQFDLLSPYATDKYVMELYAKMAYRLYGLSSIGLRFFNVYGPRQDPNSPYSGVISIFADKMLKKNAITINGGYQTRDFVYVSDVVNCIYKAILRAKQVPLCDAVNVLTGNSSSIEQLADEMYKIIGVNVGRLYNELPAGDPETSDGTVLKMQELLSVNVADMVNLKNGLRQTIDYIHSQS